MSEKKSFVPAVVAPLERNGPAWWFVFRDNTLLVRVKDSSASVPCVVDLAELNLVPTRQQYLGMLGDRHCYSAEVAEDAEAPKGMTFKGLRQLWNLFDEELIAVSGYAAQIVTWDRTHQFCGCCGTKMETDPKERAKVCPQCNLISFPRLSPVVIVAVVRDDKLLLAHGHLSPPDIYSPIAGFVEPGETLERSIQREVKEETGIDVKDIRYFGSQSWPFPHSLIMGFTAAYAGSEIKIDETELEDAGWYTADNLPPLPHKISISRQLIDWFIAEQKKHQ
jgi:NAD+ diphosphatase